MKVQQPSWTLNKGHQKPHHSYTEISKILTTPHLNGDHNWEDLWHIQLKNQQTCAFNNHNQIVEDLIWNPILADASL